MVQVCTCPQPECPTHGTPKLLVSMYVTPEVLKLCGTCDYRDESGYCQSEKLAEDIGQSEDSDMLIYDYNEGGGFRVGKRYGCVHHKWL